VLLVWKGRARGAVCVLMLALVVSLGDGVVCKNLKHLVGRLRPENALPGVHRPGHSAPVASLPPPAPTQEETLTPVYGTKSDGASMPSSHAANWFAATMILFVYYRRSLWFMLPGAILVSFSRIYNGSHYPGDVTVGAILGAGYAAASVWTLASLWHWAGQRWFPLWWRRFPSLLSPALRTVQDEEEEAPVSSGSPHSTLDQHWLRLGYILLAVLLLARLAYIGSTVIELSRDEAYQWLWSKHLALSYYSKPPMIAYTQFLGTYLWGDTAFGVRGSDDG
jgi:hypothetical protein